MVLANEIDVRRNLPRVSGKAFMVCRSKRTDTAGASLFPALNTDKSQSCINYLATMKEKASSHLLPDIKILFT